MPPAPFRKSIAKERFSAALSSAKTQTYNESASSRSATNRTIKCIAWNATGSLVATGSGNTLRVWNPEKPQVKNSTELQAHKDSVEGVVWSPVRDTEIASVSADSTCKFWDVRSRKCLASIDLGHHGFAVSWSTDGKMVFVIRSDDYIVPIIVDTYTACLPFKLGPQLNQIVCANDCLELDSHVLLIATSDGMVLFGLYPRVPAESASLKIIHQISSHTSACSCLALAPNGRYLATGGSDAIVSLWDTKQWACRRTISRLVGPIRSLSFSFDGVYVVAGLGKDGKEETTGLEVTHVETGDLVHTFPTNATAQVVAWHPSRYLLAYSGDSGGLKITGAAGGGL